MSNWKLFKIGDLCDTISETYKRNDDLVILINTSDVLDGEVLNHEPVPNKKLKGQFKKTFKRNDILYSEIRPANKRFAFIDFDDTARYIASTKLMVLRAREDIVLPQYLFAVLKSQMIIEELQHLAETRSGTFPQITFLSELAPMEIMLPDFTTQHQIVSLLTSIEGKIKINAAINENLAAINENLAQQAQAIYRSMFVSTPYESDRIGVLSELIAVKYGKDHKKLNDGIYPVYGSGGIMRYVEKPIYEKESVLIPRKGSLNNVMYIDEPFWSVDTMFYTEMKIANVAKYVFHFLRSKDLASLNAGSAVPSMTTDILNSMEVSIPSTERLADFENLVAPLYRVMKDNVRQSNNLSLLRDTLLPKLMSGDIDVSEVKI